MARMMDVKRKEKHQEEIMAHIFGFITAAKVTFAGPDEDYAEEHGWVDERDPHTLEESRNYVRPIVDCDEGDEDLADYVREALEAAPGGPFWDNGDGSFYGQSGDLTTEAGHDVSWTYAVHFVRKRRSGRAVPGLGNIPEYVEDAWHPESAGIDLSDLVQGNAPVR